jgi:hypothetical protein
MPTGRASAVRGNRAHIEQTVALGASVIGGGPSINAIGNEQESARVMNASEPVWHAERVAGISVRNAALTHGLLRELR